MWRVAERRPQHIDAMERATGKFSRWRKLFAAGVVIGLTELALWLAGADRPGFPPWASYLIGAVVALFVGYALLPGAKYLSSRITYNSRTMLSEIRNLRSEVEALQQGPPPTPTTPKKRIPTVPQNVFALKGAVTSAASIARRIGGGGRGDVPKAVRDEISSWVDETSNLLSHWPDYQKEFTGPIAYESILTGGHQSVQELTVRAAILRHIWGELVEATGTYDDSSS